MTFAQRRNRPKTHFSERIPFAKRRTTVYPQGCSPFTHVLRPCAQCLLIVALAAGTATAAPKVLSAAPVAAYAAAPLAYAPAPLAYAPAPAVVTAHSAQIVAQRFNGLAAPVVAAAYAAPAYAAPAYAAPAYAAYAHAPVLLK
jgi:hypothetical protein